ncbi:hypothetical protein EVAR_39607_1 [Eumeta japonica]|uniref:Uncharacterized protein n=1 Tax=Eumeta variegata TaxID=151549 RepID=A0A4C1Y4V7_EUMVA|nr:hypothetical protein EVAR_39607_1 [Eumeta japonica]
MEMGMRVLMANSPFHHPNSPFYRPTPPVSAHCPLNQISHSYSRGWQCTNAAGYEFPWETVTIHSLVTLMLTCPLKMM